MGKAVYHIIYNPHAAGGRSRKLIEVVMPFLQEQGLKIYLHKTKFIGHASELAAELTVHETAILVAAGGDGTASEVLNGLMHNPNREAIRFGIIPLGTGDDFVKDFGVFSVEEAVQRLLNDKTRRIDIGKLTLTDTPNQEVIYFLNMFGLGVIARGARLRRDLYSWAGKLGYHFAFFHMLPSIRAMDVSVSINQQSPVQIHTPILGVCNSQYTGYGMRISPESDTGDGNLDFLYTENIKSLELLKLFAMLPTGKHIDHPKVLSHVFQQMDIELEHPGDFMLDGEIRSGRMFRFEILPHAVELII